MLRCPRNTPGSSVATLLRGHQPVRDEPGRRGGPVWSQFRAAARRPTPRRVLAVVEASPQRSSLGAIGFDWYDPVASHALGRPGRRNAWGALDWSTGRHLGTCGRTRTDCARGVGPKRRCTQSFLCGWWRTAWPPGRSTGTRSPGATDGSSALPREHFAALVAAKEEDAPVTTYLHWSLVDNYEWGTYDRVRPLRPRSQPGHRCGALARHRCGR